MFNKIINAIADMWSEKREACIIALAYIGFMAVFFFIGITEMQLAGAIAFALLTGIYALFVWLVKKIIAQ